MKKIFVICLFILQHSFGFSIEPMTFSGVIGLSNSSTGNGIYYEHFLSSNFSFTGDLNYWYDYENEGALSATAIYYPVGSVFRPLIGLGAYGSYASKGRYDDDFPDGYGYGFPDGYSGGAKLSLGGAYFPASENIQLKLIGDMYGVNMFSNAASMYWKTGFSIGYRF